MERAKYGPKVFTRREAIPAIADAANAAAKQRVTAGLSRLRSFSVSVESLFEAPQDGLQRGIRDFVQALRRFAEVRSRFGPRSSRRCFVSPPGVIRTRRVRGLFAARSEGRARRTEPKGYGSQPEFRKSSRHATQYGRLSQLEQLYPAGMLRLDEQDSIVDIRDMGVSGELLADQIFPTREKLRVATAPFQLLFVEESRKDFTGRLDSRIAHRIHGIAWFLLRDNPPTVHPEER